MSLFKLGLVVKQGSSLSLLLRLVLFKPALTFSVKPGSLLPHSVLVKVVSNSTLLSTIPAALVFTPIAPDEFALAMALVFLELAHVLFAIRPLQMTNSMHLIVQPLALVLLFIAPDVCAFALDLVHLKFSVVD